MQFYVKWDESIVILDVTITGFRYVNLMYDFLHKNGFTTLLAHDGRD